MIAFRADRMNTTARCSMEEPFTASSTSPPSSVAIRSRTMMKQAASVRCLRGENQEHLHAGIVGLGDRNVGDLRTSRLAFRFYELNPVVEKLAQTYFTYLSSCSGTVSVVLGMHDCRSPGNRTDV